MKKSIRTLLFIILVILTFLSILGGLIFAVAFVFDEDVEQYALAREINNLGIRLRAYKREHGTYPKDILELVPSGKICFHEFYTRCKRIHYKPFADLSDFRMALDKSWGIIIFYDPHVTMDDEINKSISDKERKERIESGRICGYCRATPEGTNPKRSYPYPVYRQDPLYFPNPDEWPKL